MMTLITLPKNTWNLHRHNQKSACELNYESMFIKKLQT